jgi:acylphosphatase
MNHKVRARVFITGRVQGVFFRMATQNEAKRHGLSGWAKNKADGSVEVVFEGEKTAVEALLEWCKTGPPYARVEQVEIQWEESMDELDHFEIRY